MTKYVTYKGYRNKVLSETRTIIFSAANVLDQTKPDLSESIIVELNKDAPKRITARYIQTLLELEAAQQDKNLTNIVFANVITERYQRYELSSVMETRSGTVTTDKLYKFVDNKFILESTKLTDDMY